MNERDKELAKQTSLHRNNHTTEQRIAELQKFADLIRADEREACADLCYQLVDNSRETRFASAIRARGNT
jgi:hypothetical protein